MYCVYMTMGYFHHRLHPLFFYYTFGSVSILAIIFIRLLFSEHVSTSLVALIQSKCHSPPLCVYFIILSYIGWLFFYLIKRGVHSPFELACRCHIQVTTPLPQVLQFEQKWVPGIPDHICSRTHLKLSLNMHFLACRILWLLSMLVFDSVWLM